VSMRQFAGLIGAAAWIGVPRISRVPNLALRLVGVFQPQAREMVEMLYEFEEPHVVDSSKIQRAFGLVATPLAESIPPTLAWWQQRS